MKWMVYVVCALCACAPSRRDVFRPVAGQVSARTGYDVAWRAGDPALVQRLASDGLTAEEAARIALVNDPSLQAAFEELGLARAELLGATIANPELEAEVLFPLEGDEDPTVEVSAVLDVLDLIVVARRRSVASAELEAARARAVGAAVDTLSNARAAFYRAQAAAQMLELRQTIAEATEASFLLAKKMHAAGNTTDLALAQERVLHQQARLELRSAEEAAVTARTALAAALGVRELPPDVAIATRLPELPAEATDLAALEQEAARASLDVAEQQWRVRAAGRAVGLAALRRWLPELGLGVTAEREGDGAWGVGPAMVVSLPLFDWGQGAVAAGEAQRRRARASRAAAELAAVAAARTVRERLASARERAAFLRDELLPLHEHILDEMLRQYNAMAASQFDLLQAKRQQIEAAAAYVDALLDYWLARVEVDRVRAGRARGIDVDIARPDTPLRPERRDQH